MKLLYTELLERLNILTAQDQTEEVKIRISELNNVVLRIQQFLLEQLN